MSTGTAVASISANAFAAVVTASPRRHLPLPAGRQPASTSSTNGDVSAAGSLVFAVV